MFSISLNDDIDKNNSSNILLNSNEIFYGESTNLNKYNYITINIECDVSSTNNGLILYSSNNNINWNILKTYTYDSSINFCERNTICFKYFKL